MGVAVGRGPAAAREDAALVTRVERLSEGQGDQAMRTTHIQHPGRSSQDHRQHTGIARVLPQLRRREFVAVAQTGPPAVVHQILVADGDRHMRTIATVLRRRLLDGDPPGQLDQGIGAPHRPGDLRAQRIAPFQRGAVSLVGERLDLCSKECRVTGGHTPSDDR